MRKVTVYTDGAAKGNPGPGGYGVVLMSGPHRKELAEGFKETTNNRMELLAVIKALEALKESCEVTVYSDSKYVVDAIEKGWLRSWISKNFKGKKNIDLWRRYILAAKDHKVKFVWVKGHAGNVENERCDRLAVMASEGSNLQEDKGYTSNNSSLF